MKTKQQAANEFANLNYANFHKDTSETSFLAGVEFAESWISVEDDLPENNSKVLTDIDIACWFKNGKFKI